MSIEPWSPPAPEVWKVMQDQADLLARSNIVPRAFRNKPADVLVAVMTGQELGLGPTTALSYIHVIEGKATLSAEGMVALARRAGHSIHGTTSPTGASVTGKRGDTGDEMTVDFTDDDARRAGLLGKGPWKSYPSAMHWARAVSQLCRYLFPDVLMGVSYQPEELGGEPADSDLAEHVETTTDGPVENEPVEAEVVGNPYTDKALTDATLKTRRSKFAQAVGQWATDNDYDGEVADVRHAIIERATGKTSSKDVETEAEWDAIRDVFKRVTVGELTPEDLMGDDQ